MKIDVSGLNSIVFSELDYYISSLSIIKFNSALSNTEADIQFVNTDVKL